MNELATRENNFDLVPRSLQEAMSFSEIISKSAMIPREYHGKPGDVLIAIQYGAELGLKPLQALQSIACINGKPCIFGDALLGVVQASPLYEWHDESESNDKQGVCIVKRHGVPPVKSVFTLDDAKRAGLLGKAGPWTQYTSRMMKMRARGFALRDAFSDVLKGIVQAEEALDIPTVCTVDAPALPPPTLKDKLKAQVEGPPVQAVETRPAEPQAECAESGTGVLQNPDSRTLDADLLKQEFDGRLTAAQNVKDCAQVRDDVSRSDLDQPWKDGFYIQWSKKMNQLAKKK